MLFGIASESFPLRDMTWAGSRSIIADRRIIEAAT